MRPPQKTDFLRAVAIDFVAQTLALKAANCGKNSKVMRFARILNVKILRLFHRNFVFQNKKCKNQSSSTNPRSA